MKNKLDYPYETVENNAVCGYCWYKNKRHTDSRAYSGPMCWLVKRNISFYRRQFELRDGKIAVFSDLFNMDSKTQVDSLKFISSLPKAEFIFTDS